MKKFKQWFQLIRTTIYRDDVDMIENNDSSSFETSFLEPKVVPQIKDTDLEFLFHQLLEGVVNGWQENRIAQFLQKLEPKIPLEKWLEWLQSYRTRLLSSPSPHTQLVVKMQILGKLASTASIPLVRAIADAVDKISQELLNRRDSLLTSESLLLSTTAESSGLVPDYPIQTDSQSDQLNKHRNVLGNIISSLQQNPLSEVDQSETFEIEDYIDPAMAQIEKETSSDTEPPSISENNSLDSSSTLRTEENDSEAQSVSSNVKDNLSVEELFANVRDNLSVEELFALALEKAKTGDIEKALPMWQEVVSIDPNFAPAWHNLGSAFAHLNRLTEAIEHFDKALAININDYLSWNDRGNALFRLERWQEAIISWDRVIGVKPDFDQVWYHRGLALEKLEEYAEAMISYKKCLSINPNFTPAQKHYQKLRLSTVIVEKGKRKKVEEKK